MANTERLERGHRREHRRRSRHVGLHGLHARRGLQRETTRVEHHALADQGQGSRLTLPSGLVRHLDEPRSTSRTLTHAEHSSHLLGPQLGLRHHGHRHALAGQEPPRCGRELRRGLRSGRLVHHVARPADCRRDSCATLEANSSPRVMVANDVDAGELGGLAVGLVREEPIRAENKALGNRLSGRLRRDTLGRGLRDCGHHRSGPDGAPGDGRSGPSQRVGRDGVTIAQANQHRGGRPDGSSGRDNERLVRLPGESRLGHEVAKRSAHRSVDHVGPRAEHPIGEHRHREQLSSRPGGRLVRHAKSNRHRRPPRVTSPTL